MARWSLSARRPREITEWNCEDEVLVLVETPRCQVPEPWDVCQKELHTGIETTQERWILWAGKREGIWALWHQTWATESVFALVGSGLALTLNPPLWSSDLYSVLLNIGRLWYAFWFCMGLQLRDYLESQKRLLKSVKTVKDYGHFRSWTNVFCFMMAPWDWVPGSKMWRLESGVLPTGPGVWTLGLLVVVLVGELWKAMVEEVHH